MFEDPSEYEEFAQKRDPRVREPDQPLEKSADTPIFALCFLAVCILFATVVILGDLSV